MATVIYPAALPKPLINITRSQSPGFQLKQPLAGPGYAKQMTSDSPATYELSWRMSREKALQFMAWFYGKTGLNRGFNRFTISVDTEFGPQDHTFQLTPDNLLPAAQEASNVFSYSATAICRKVPIPAVYTDHADLIVLDAYNYRAEIDVAMNQVWPESYPEPVVIPGTTAAFTSGLYYSNNNAVAFSNMVTFSRATTATYVDKDGALKTSAINEPRFESGGLLVEPQSTNLYRNSGASAGISASDWYPNNTANSSLAIVQDPKIGEMATIVSTSTENASRYLWVRPGSTQTIAANTTVTISAWVYRPVGSKFRQLRLGSSGVSPAFTVHDIAEGELKRVSHTAQIAAENNIGNLYVWPIANSTAETCIVGEELLSIGCVQIETAPCSSSYIPTNGAAATRAADSASVLMQPHSAGTIFAEFLSDSVAVERIVYTAGDITMKRLATGAIAVTAGAVTVTSAVVPSGSVKSAISYDGSTLKLAVNGVVYSAASTLPSAGTSLVLGASTFANVWQRSDAYDDDRLIEVTQ